MKEGRKGMLDHIGIGVSNLDRSRIFYDAALEPIGIRLLWQVPPEQTESGGTALVYGSGGRPYFWVGEKEHTSEGTHVAFLAGSRAEVHAFHSAATSAGGRDNGAPGPRPHYHPNYYGAFVLDADGVNVEAVCHEPE
jgi:catechol 2,3-dioxygenase-like lactoylglutathione lyase family enzyme